MPGDLDARWSALVESGRARWCPGMLVGSGITMRLDWLDPDGRWNGAYSHTRGGPRGGWLRVIEASMAGEWVPNWTDPATLGCLLGLVRERWGQGDMAAMYWTMEGPKRWCIEFTGRDDFEGPPGVEYDGAWYGETEAEALLAALEASPTTA